LGGEQHGFIASVGFDLYSQMLAEEIEQRKAALDAGGSGGEPAASRKPKTVSTQIEVTLDAYLPGEYIYDSAQKIEIYKKVAAVQSFEEAAEIAEELTDRFGEMPTPVKMLLAVARLKLYGSEYGI